MEVGTLFRATRSLSEPKIGSGSGGGATFIEKLFDVFISSLWRLCHFLGQLSLRVWSVVKSDPCEKFAFFSKGFFSGHGFSSNYQHRIFPPRCKFKMHHSAKTEQVARKKNPPSLTIFHRLLWVQSDERLAFDQPTKKKPYVLLSSTWRGVVKNRALVNS